MALADFNGDGFVDIAVANNGLGSSQIAVHRNLTPLGFPGLFAAGLNLANSADIPRIAVGDVTGDGLIDIVAVSGQGTFGKQLQVYRNVTLPGGAISFVAGPVGALSFTPGAIGVGDLDPRAGLEIAVVDLSAKALRIYSWDGVAMLGAEVASAQIQSPLVGVYASSNSEITVCDMEGDGDDDVVLTANDEVFVFTQSGGLGAATPMALPTQGGAGVGDVDGNGLMDVVASDGLYASPLRLLSQVAPGTFVSSILFVPGQCPGGACQAAGEIELGDAQGDGLLDVFFVRDLGGAFVDIGLGVSVAPGQFAAPVSVCTPSVSGANARPSVAVVDVDGDGRDDIVRVLVGYPSTSTVEVWLNATTLGRAVLRNGGTNPISLTALCGPVTGTTWTVHVDSPGTGHASALLFGYDTAVSFPLPGGQTLLCLDLGGSGELLAQSIKPTPTLAILPVPNAPALWGITVSVQAIHLGAVTPFALSNALDVTIGNT